MNYDLNSFYFSAQSSSMLRMYAVIKMVRPSSCEEKLSSVTIEGQSCSLQVLGFVTQGCLQWTSQDYYY